MVFLIVLLLFVLAIAIYVLFGFIATLFVSEFDDYIDTSASHVLLWPMILVLFIAKNFTKGVASIGETFWGILKHFMVGDDYD